MLYLTFKAGENEYALDAARVLQVVPGVPLRPVPDAPDHIAGLLNFRGSPVIVVDLVKLIARIKCRRLFSARIIITDCARAGGGQATLLGLLAEDITTLMKREPADLMENALNTAETSCLGQMFRDDERLIQIIKIERLVTGELEHMLAAGMEEFSKTQAG
ncbi:MAG: chemotaxis protein CheW [Kiritimatiellae bacterium]|nr:chemotaxis protein CheW [Kiritimatiellia bacterium]